MIVSDGLVSTPGGLVTFQPAPADLILYGTNADFNPQNPGHIETVIEDWTGAELTLVSESSMNSGRAGLIDVDANVYAIHFGDNELVFGFADRPDDFTFAGLDYDISNYRAYQCDNCGSIQTNEVPLPAAVWMFGSAMLGLGGIARKRKAQV
jgi:hypothetical protein